MPGNPEFQILLVDDNAADAHIFENALQQAGTRARVWWVTNGQEALDFLRQRGRFEGVSPVKIVVLDLNLPGDDGFEILRRIKADPVLNRKPVILFTSAVSQAEVDLAYSLGANAYFRKPITLERYVEQVRIVAQYWLDLALLPSQGSSSDLLPDFPERHRSSIDTRD